jgi:hypothetical protein
MIETQLELHPHWARGLRPRAGLEGAMSRQHAIRRLAALGLVAGCMGISAAQAKVCTDSLAENPSNVVRLCAWEASDLTMRIVPEGLEISWTAPPPASSTFVGPVLSGIWNELDSLQVVPSVEVRGTYRGTKDRLIRLDVVRMGSGNDSVAVFGGPLAVQIAWQSVYEGRLGVRGEFTVDAGTVDRPLRFDVPKAAGVDTTNLAGLRVVFRSGYTVRRQDDASFEVQDFEGYHVWRSGGNQTATGRQVIGEYSRVADTRDPSNAWLAASPTGSQFTFVDRNVFDGFTYQYAVTTYDQGFDSRRGTTLAFKIDYRDPSDPNRDPPFPFIRYEFRRPPSESFQPITAVPNPYYDSAIDPRREETNFVFFTNAPARGTLYIYTLAGDLVLEQAHDQASVGTITWDTRNGRGEPVSSGVYIYKIVDLISGQQSYGRLAVVR